MIHTASKNRVAFPARAFFAALGPILAAATMSAGSATAASEMVLYSFCQQANCADGAFPGAGLIATTNGGLYGTTTQGGSANAGVAFLVSIAGGHGILHAFQGSFNDGAAPAAPLFRDQSGNFYGTTSSAGPSSSGTIFKRSASGAYTLMHAFNGTDGSFPFAGLFADSAANLFGTTTAGGAHGSGTIFRLTPSGTLTMLYSFCSTPGCPDGYDPVAGLTGDANGNLYGTAFSGGTGASGVVFKIHADGTNYTVLHSFRNGTDGAKPLAGLAAGPSGNLYGTTELGGANGSGTVFEIAPDGSNYAVLYSFCSLASCADGAEPGGGVILDAGGNLYGTALAGGAHNKGAVFALTPSGTETVLYSFCSSSACADGSNPIGNLVALGPGTLYGTTASGGSMGAGTVYQLTDTGFVPQ